MRTDICERLSFVCYASDEFTSVLCETSYVRRILCVHAQGAERVVNSTSALPSGDLSRKCIRKFSVPPGRFLRIGLSQSKRGRASRHTSTAVRVITGDTAS